MPSEPQVEVARARSLAELVSHVSLALDEFDSAFTSRVESVLRSSLLEELRDLYEKVNDEIKTWESHAAILSDSGGRDVWAVYDSAFSPGQFRFRVILIPRGKTPQEEYDERHPALKAAAFRRLVEELVESLRAGRINGHVGTTADGLIGYCMPS